MFRRRGRCLEVLLVHPGGPFFRNRDEGAWSIPKGEVEQRDDALDTARREFREEIGIEPEGDFLDLGEVRQKGGKIVRAWAFEGDRDEDGPPPSNTFEIEWPPRSGRRQSFPEVDRAEFFDPVTARGKMNPAQAEFLDRLETALGVLD